MKIAFFSTQPFEKPVFEALHNSYPHDITYLDYHLTADTIAAIPKVDGICCFVNDQINNVVIDGLKQKGVQLIALRSAGYNHVDYVYAKQQGITVCRVPKYSPHAVAEHAVALILSLNRHIHRAHQRIRENNFSLQGLMGFDLYQKTIGIIGTGNIGRVFAQIMQGFGCRVIAFDPYPDEQCHKQGVTYVDLSTLLKMSDIVSIHCPLNTQTLHLINHQSLALMKPGSMLINTSRGKIIDTKAVIDALKSQHLGYLGIDVYEEEERLFFIDHSEDCIQDDLFCRLQTFPNVLITGHQGFFTQEAIYNIAKVTLENITHFEKGIEPVFIL